MKQWIKPVIFILLIASAVIVINITGVAKELTFKNLVNSRDTIKNLVKENYLWSVLIYTGVYFAVTALSVPGAAILTLAGGFLFGTIPAALYVNVGATLGASGSFFAARYFIGEVVQKKYSENLKNFNAEIKSNGVNYLLMLRFIPAIPFFLINILAGMTRIGFFTFLWTTSAGIIPGSLVYAYAGSNLGNLKSASGILSWPIISALLLLALFSVVPVLLKKLFKPRNA